MHVTEGGPHLQMMTGGSVLQVREGGPPLQGRVAGHRAERREIHHRKQVKATSSRSHPLHLQRANSRPQRVPPKPLPTSSSPRE